jgi:hypothetical protein
MKNTLSLTALALLATALLAPMNANAADRQITVNPKKFPSFTVNRDEAPGVDVAEAAPAEKPIKVSPKAFRVDDKPVQEANDTPKFKPKKQKPVQFKVEDRPGVIEQASDDAPRFTPKPKNKTLRFRVEDQNDQAAAEPTRDDENEVAATDNDRPVNLLNEKVKLIKKVKPAPVEADEEEATTDDTDHSADIAADTGEEEAVEAPVKRKAPRLYYYASKQKTYEAHQDYNFETPAYEEDMHQDNYSYQDSGYTGSSCHQNLSY